MRKLMWFAIGFALSCGLCAYVLPMRWLRNSLIAVGILACALGLLGRKRLLLRRAALLFLGCILGLWWYSVFQTWYLAAPAALDERTQVVTIRTVDYSTGTDYGTSVEGTLLLEGKHYRLRVYLDETVPLEPGKLITGPFRFSMTAPSVDPVSYLSGEGIFLLARQEDAVQIVKDQEEHWQDRIARLRQGLRQNLAVCIPEDAFPFAQALLLGDTSALDYETDTDFKVSGIRHVVAVSGLHVSILIALLTAVTFRKKYLMVPVGLGTLLLFAALAGFTPSVTRACIMSGLLLLALLFNREYDGATALAFAVLVMLLGNPLVIASVSFQLSVASVAGIYCFRRGIREWLHSLYPHPKGKGLGPKLIAWLDTSVSISLSAMVFTTPLCAWYFGMVSLVGVVTNLLALWVISGIFYGILAVCWLHSLWQAAAVLLGKTVAWPIRYVLAVAGTLADLPLAAVYTESVYITAWLVFVYILLILFYVSRNRRPWQLLCCGVLGLCFALVASWGEAGASDTRITVLDVGQGQCILLQSEGRTWMVDCGGEVASAAADLAAGTLLSQGIVELDGMILTNLNEDHAGGAQKLLTRMDTRVLVLPPERTDLAASTQAAVVYADEELSVSMGNASIRAFPATYPGTSGEKSLCVLFDTENCDILITGDRDGFGERMLLRRAELPDVDVLVAGHHGSGHSTCEELLSAVRPELVCISAGRGNVFGLPARELLERLEQFGCTVYRTDLHRTITIRR